MALELLTTLKHTYMQLGSSALRHFNATLGETLCAANRRDEGLQVLMPRLAQEERDDISPNAPGLARLRTVTGNCALATGDRAMALALAKKARAAFAEQPGVSPYYKAPLFKLERALGLRLPPV
jgi:hypothetical protein